MRKPKMLPALIIASLVLIGSSSAIWLSGFVSQGTVISTSTEPAYMTFDLGEFDITTANSTTYFTYNNPNSEADVNMTLNMEIISTDALCHYTEGTDFELLIDNEYGDFIVISNGNSVVRTMPPGDTEIYVMASPHIGICPLEGNITITGQLV